MNDNAIIIIAIFALFMAGVIGWAVQRMIANGKGKAK